MILFSSSSAHATALPKNFPCVWATAGGMVCNNGAMISTTGDIYGPCFNHTETVITTTTEPSTPWHIF
jgi:hypothetical protein